MNSSRFNEVREKALSLENRFDSVIRSGPHHGQHPGTITDTWAPAKKIGAAYSLNDYAVRRLTRVREIHKITTKLIEAWEEAVDVSKWTLQRPPASPRNTFKPSGNTARDENGISPNDGEITPGAEGPYPLRHSDTPREGSRELHPHDSREARRA